MPLPAKDNKYSSVAYILYCKESNRTNPTSIN